MDSVELRFLINTSGQEALDQVAGLVESVGKSTKASSGELKIFETVLRACVESGQTLKQALSDISKSEESLGRTVANAAKEFVSQADEAERSAARQAAAADKKAKSEEDAWRRILRAQDSANRENQRMMQAQINSAQQTGSAITGAITSPMSGIAAMGSRVAAALGPVGIAIATVVAALTLGTKVAYDFTAAQASAAKETYNLGLRLGLTGGQAANLSAEAKLAGVNINSLQSAVRTLSSALEDPTLSGAKVAAGLKDIDVSIYDAAGHEREMGAVVLDTINNLGKLTDSSRVAFDAQRILGRQGAKELLPLVEQNQELQRQLEAVGVHYDDDLINKLKQADTQIQTISASWQLVKSQLAETLAPIVIPIVWKLIGPPDHSQDQPFTNADGKRLTVADVSARRNGYGTTAPQQIGQGKTGDVLAYLQGLDNPDRKRSQQITDEYQKHFANTLEGLTAALKKAQDDLKEHQSKILSGNLDATHNQAEVSAAKADEAKIERLQEQIRNSRGGRSQNNSAEAILNELAERGFKAQYPASIYGRAPEIIAQRQQFQYRLNHDEGLTPQQRSDFMRRYDTEKGGYSDQVIQAIREALDKRSDQTYDTQKIITGGKLEDVQAAASLQQRLSEINGGKQETTADIEAAYQRQLDLLKQIKAAREADLELLKGETNEVKKRNEQEEITKNYDRGKAQADEQRQIAEAQLKRRQQESAERVNNELGKLSDNATVDSLRQSLNKQQQIALLQNDGKETPEIVLQGLNSQLEIARQIYDIHVKDNDSITDADQRRIENARAFDTLTRDSNQARLDAELKLLELQKQSLDRAKQQAGELFDAMLKGGNSVQQFFKGQAEQIGKNAFEAAVGPMIQSLGQTVGGNAGPLSYLFKGTILEGDKNANVNRSQDANTRSTDLNTQATYMLYQQLGGTGTIPGVTGAPVAATGGQGAPGTTLSSVQSAIGALTGNGGSSISSGGQSQLQSALALALGVSAGIGATFAPATSGPLSQPSLAVPSSSAKLGFGGNAGNDRWDNGVTLQRALGLTAGVGLPVLSALKLFGGGSSGGSSDDPLAAAFGGGVVSSGSSPSGLAQFLSGTSSAGSNSWNVFGSDASMSTKIGAGVGDAAIAATGITQAIQQFSKGGARGILGGIGATSSTAASLDPEPISKAILSAIGIGSTLFKSILGDPLQIRQNEERNDMEVSQYMAPAQINRTLSTDGTENALDIYGHVKSTPYSTLQIQSPYMYKNPDTGAVEVMPGQVIEPYQQTPQQPNYIAKYSGNSSGPSVIVNMPVQAIDSQDIMRRSGDITSAVQKGMIQGHPITALVQRVARNQ